MNNLLCHFGCLTVMLIFQACRGEGTDAIHPGPGQKGATNIQAANVDLPNEPDFLIFYSTNESKIVTYFIINMSLISNAILI